MFFGFFIGAIVMAAVLAFGLPAILKSLPRELINLLKQTILAQPATLRSPARVFQCLVGVVWRRGSGVLLFTFNYAVESNLDPDQAPRSRRNAAGSPRVCRLRGP